MTKNTPNQVVYVETGLNELKCEVYKRQHKFWSHILESIEKDPSTEISRIIKDGIDKNIPYLKHYKHLVSKYDSPHDCCRKMQSEFRERLKVEYIPLRE